jgi:hypothetical protein
MACKILRAVTMKIIVLVLMTFSVVYFTVLSKTLQHKIVEWLINDELERIWKEVVFSSYHPGICLEEMRKTTTIQSC